jgi:NadR type nicotinamide-nucleotide adenylyltransferase
MAQTLDRKSEDMLKRISVTGPESTGKSWLAEHLSAHFEEPWVPEYARVFLENLNAPYTFDDVLHIAKGQFEAENDLAKTAKEFLFCDTDFLVTHIWCLVKFGKSHTWIEEMLETHRYTHYLLCSPDLPWQADPLREHPNLRKELFEMYKTELQNRNFSFSIVSGEGDERLQHAIDAILSFDKVNLSPDL